MSGPDLPGARWRTSSHSGGKGDNGDCVEVAVLPGGAVVVRDSKDRGGAQHRLSAAAWRAFVAATRAGEFDS